MMNNNLSFCGCGFLAFYHVGALKAFKDYAPEYLNDKMSGSSCGSLIAACAICNCSIGLI